MIHYLKRAIQKPLIRKRHRLYEERIIRQSMSYETWLKAVLESEEAEIEEWKKKREAAGTELLQVKVISREELEQYFAGDRAGWETEVGKDGILVFTPHPECLTKGAVWEIKRYFAEHPEKAIAYGEESDYFKPGWSPDLLQSFFYFGRVFAVKQSLLNDAAAKYKIRNTAAKQEEKITEFRLHLYELVLNCMDIAKEAGHIEKVLYLSKETERNTDWGMEPVYDEVKKGHLYSDVDIADEKEKQELVSVIIPSKDNPAVLSNCIHSLREETDYRNLEIIVIDNGSNEKNRARILRMQKQLKEEYSFQYYYQPMEFNFSAMCNIGAGKAKGSYLLFLNDDIEIVRQDWLRTMMKRAEKSYVGAVGVKLLYPDSHRIQHLGITSIHLGPAHKLQFASDKEKHYHGINRCAINVSAVTGACLLLKKETFEEAGGFLEELSVSFNDVELCFHILKSGYRNVCCNDTYLYHHESLSRGADSGIEKVRRLHQERNLLYSRYPEMWNRDACYSGKMVTDILDRNYEGAYRFEEKRVSKKAEVLRIDGELDPAWHNDCLYMGLEFTGDENAWRCGKPGGGDYYIQGWSYAVNVDNSRYNKSILLKPLCLSDIPSWKEADLQAVEGALWKIPYEECYRSDLEENLPYIDHPALSGVSIWIDRDALPAGEYLIGYFWEDSCSRQKLYGFSAETLVIAEDNKR